MLKRELVSFFLVICFVFISTPVASCKSTPPIIYVAGDGTGDYNCVGKSDQVQINQALQFVTQNKGYTTVHLKGPFTYVIDNSILIGSNTILEGDSSAVIKLANHAGWPVMKPLIQQMSNSGNEDITVRGFEVNGNFAGNNEITLGRGYYNIMYFTNSNNIKVYNMYLHDGMGDGLRVNNCKNIQFYNNNVYKLGHDGMFALHSCENVEAWNNRITCRTNSGLRTWNSNNVKLHDNVIDSFDHWSAGGPGIQIEKGEATSIDKGVVNDVEIFNNVIYNTYGPGIWLIGYGNTPYTKEEAKNVHIHNNIFYSTGTNPNIDWVGGVVASGFYDTLIENNVFDGVYNAAVVHTYPPHVHDNSDLSPISKGYTTFVRNNIIVNTLERKFNPSGTGCGIANYLTDTHFFMIDNDCLFNNAGGNYKNCASTTDIYVNPFVADLKNHDYHLQSTAGRWNGKSWIKDKTSSLCIDAGYLYSEYINEPEPNGKRINIGPDGNTLYASKSEQKTVPLFPTANFNTDKTNGYAPLSVQFFDTSENENECKWDFGDGTTSNQQNPIHVYSVAGTYYVNLTASNENGTNSKSATIKVSERPIIPVADFSISITNGYAPLSVQFTDLSQYGESRSWDFTNDGIPDSNSLNPVYTYAFPGTYTVNLVVRNANGSNSKFDTIYVLSNPVLPTADFNSNVTRGYAPLIVQFFDLSKKSTSWAWDFGDGVISKQKSPIHTYVSAGTYNVALVVSNENGTSSKIAAINVLENNNSSGGNSTGENNSSGSSNDISTNEGNSSTNLSEGNNSGISTSEEISNMGSSDSSSGGGGGGGAGGSPEPQSNVEIKELSQSFVTSGKPVKFEFPRNTTPVVSISFDSKKTAGKTTTITEMLKEKSTLVSRLPSDEVYRYLNIWVGNSGFATTKNIENAVIYFKVEKSWIQNKNIEKSSIILNRYNDKTWNQLPTKLSNEDDKYFYYLAQTPGFSPFAITGKTAAIKKHVTGTQPQFDKTRVELKNTSNVTNSKRKEKASTSGFEILYGIIGVLGVFLYTRR